MTGRHDEPGGPFAFGGDDEIDAAEMLRRLFDADDEENADTDASTAAERGHARPAAAAVSAPDGDPVWPATADTAGTPPEAARGEQAAAPSVSSPAGRAMPTPAGGDPALTFRPSAPATPVDAGTPFTASTPIAAATARSSATNDAPTRSETPGPTASDLDATQALPTASDVPAADDHRGAAHDFDAILAGTAPSAPVDERAFVPDTIEPPAAAPHEAAPLAEPITNGHAFEGWGMSHRGASASNERTAPEASDEFAFDGTANVALRSEDIARIGATENPAPSSADAATEMFPVAEPTDHAVDEPDPFAPVSPVVNAADTPASSSSIFEQTANATVSSAPRAESVTPPDDVPGVADVAPSHEVPPVQPSESLDDAAARAARGFGVAPDWLTRRDAEADSVDASERRPRRRGFGGPADAEPTPPTAAPEAPAFASAPDVSEPAHDAFPAAETFAEPAASANDSAPLDAAGAAHDDDGAAVPASRAEARANATGAADDADVAAGGSALGGMAGSAAGAVSSAAGSAAAGIAAAAAGLAGAIGSRFGGGSAGAGDRTDGSPAPAVHTHESMTHSGGHVEPTVGSDDLTSVLGERGLDAVAGERASSGAGVVVPASSPDAETPRATSHSTRSPYFVPWLRWTLVGLAVVSAVLGLLAIFRPGSTEVGGSALIIVAVLLGLVGIAGRLPKRLAGSGWEIEFTPQSVQDTLDLVATQAPEAFDGVARIARDGVLGTTAVVEPMIRTAMAKADADAAAREVALDAAEAAASRPSATATDAASALARSVTVEGADGGSIRIDALLTVPQGRVAVVAVPTWLPATGSIVARRVNEVVGGPDADAAIVLVPASAVADARAALSDGRIGVIDIEQSASVPLRAVSLVTR